MAPLNLPVVQTSITVRVQPVVLFSICDAYIRRNEGKDRVIGTLLGSISEGVVDIRECYAVPHNESMYQVPKQTVDCCNEAALRCWPMQLTNGIQTGGNGHCSPQNIF